MLGSLSSHMMLFDSGRVMIIIIIIIITTIVIIVVMMNLILSMISSRSRSRSRSRIPNSYDTGNSSSVRSCFPIPSSLIMSYDT